MKKIAEGHSAEIYLTEEGEILKLFPRGFPKDYVEFEYRNAKALDAMALPVPQAKRIVMVDESPFESLDVCMMPYYIRRGILYEYIEGETMHKNDLAMFCALQRDFLSKKAPELMDYREFLRTLVQEKADPSLLEKIDALPDGDALLHGDFHPKNIIIKKDGDPVVIDFMNVCRGDALFDIARTYFLLSEQDEAFAEAYLLEMGTEKEELTPFLDVIKETREFE